MEIKRVTKVNRRFLCLCDCWNTTDVDMINLRSSRIKSCGCLLKDTVTTHWLSWSRFYTIYVWMRWRCNRGKKGERVFDWYKWRWIKCEWEDFISFRDDMHASYIKSIESCGNEKDVTIERINNDWNYCKSNCKFIHKNKQGENKRNTIYINFNWKKMRMNDAIVELWITYNQLRYRMYDKKMTVDDSVNEILKIKAL